MPECLYLVLNKEYVLNFKLLKKYVCKFSTNNFRTLRAFHTSTKDKQLQLELPKRNVKQKKNAPSKYPGIEV